MFLKKNYSLLRENKLYEQVISFCLYKMAREGEISSCSISFSILNNKRDFLKVYLVLSKEGEKKETVNNLNTKFKGKIRRAIYESKHFSRIPNVFFLLDERNI
jgi:hypothetical protein